MDTTEIIRPSDESLDPDDGDYIADDNDDQDGSGDDE